MLVDFEILQLTNLVSLQIFASMVNSACLNETTFPLSLKTLTVNMSLVSTLDFLKRLPSTLEALSLHQNCIGGTEDPQIVPFEPLTTGVIKFPGALQRLDLSSNPRLYMGYSSETLALAMRLRYLDLSNTGIQNPRGLEGNGLSRRKRQKVV
ncbi:hypothetical protein BABINDRAFT_10187 [Babjeviella inositovora NRRL Y-12698]|uniref:Uncharacterized protein n=1 Tax=Babjeviella inositovora NRRL Y-12698 TaxID=984486 RepID=A0A1E3QHV9_9ASCO|nr:uncharacterized protein BABINDRAFT_10187 [Babjeviella inositovora NRRL Y-12698]ODQ77276.1 hypothetical protein BABINDRAFT_10187 [Babjeviella inositovora NRRL Y-12698]